MRSRADQVGSEWGTGTARQAVQGGFPTVALSASGSSRVCRGGPPVHGRCSENPWNPHEMQCSLGVTPGRPAELAAYGGGKDSPCSRAFQAPFSQGGWGVVKSSLGGALTGFFPVRADSCQQMTDAELAEDVGSSLQPRGVQSPWAAQGQCQLPSGKAAVWSFNLNTSVDVNFVV